MMDTNHLINAPYYPTSYLFPSEIDKRLLLKSDPFDPVNPVQYFPLLR